MGRPFGFSALVAVAITVAASAGLVPSAAAATLAATQATAAVSGTPAGTDTTDATPSHYYVWRTRTPPYAGPRDRRGVVMTRLSGVAAPVYSPTPTAQWAIHFYENWLLDGKASELDDFLVQARWLRDSMDARGRLAHPQARKDRGLAGGWYSAMGQGLAVSVFVRAHQVSGDEGFLAAARLASRPFFTDVSRGGVVTEGGRWLEEYPDGNHVLNGSLFAAFGLYDLVRTTGDPEAGRAWRTFTANLAVNIERYESNGAILYELVPDRYCHTRYFDLHLRQLRSLAQLTGDPVFASTANRWEGSFRAYPEPRFRLRQHRGSDGRVRVEGEIDYLYDYYYPRRPTVTVSRISSQARSAVVTVAVSYDESGQRGRFSWTAPVSASDAAYLVSLSDRPKTPDRRYDYRSLPSTHLVVPATARWRWLYLAVLFTGIAAAVAGVSRLAIVARRSARAPRG